MASYDSTVIADFNRALKARGVTSTKVAKSLFEAGIVESNLQNLNHGDRDSLGALQQRPSQGWGHATDPYRAALDYLDQAIPLAGKYKTSGQLAQGVQRSAYPGRYDQVGGQAASLLGGLGGGQVQPQANTASAASASGAPQLLDPGTGSDVTSLLSSLLAKPQQAAPQSAGIQAPSFSAAPPLPKGFQGLLPTAPQAAPAQSGVSDALSLAAALGSTGPTVGSPGASQTADGPQMPQAPSSQAAAAPPSKSGVATFDGKKVAAWIAPALEYARSHGWKGSVNSGYRSFEDQTRIYNSGVRPAAKPGTSNHEGAEFPRGAVDVTDAQQLSDILKNSPYRTKLQWAGAKDPVHFSHPHNGSY